MYILPSADLQTTWGASGDQLPCSGCGRALRDALLGPFWKALAQPLPPQVPFVPTSQPWCPHSCFSWTELGNKVDEWIPSHVLCLHHWKLSASFLRPVWWLVVGKQWDGGDPRNATFPVLFLTKKSTEKKITATCSSHHWNTGPHLPHSLPAIFIVYTFQKLHFALSFLTFSYEKYQAFWEIERIVPWTLTYTSLRSHHLKSVSYLLLAYLSICQPSLFYCALSKSQTLRHWVSSARHLRARLVPK